ncbi:hypothetical protein HX89_12935 [Dermacoccus nishinomiyaensis]|uniref:Uncharacterized protein n=1 Tax=Dermacoccus nishinomiyaensis TaxID=1274 RepID=A0A075JNI4_9MICO|nr:hypothetical protein HX89_12935 [Dermacoccus nishinomiyaensis]
MVGAADDQLEEGTSVVEGGEVDVLGADAADVFSAADAEPEEMVLVASALVALSELHAEVLTRTSSGMAKVQRLMNTVRSGRHVLALKSSLSRLWFVPGAVGINRSAPMARHVAQVGML